MADPRRQQAIDYFKTLTGQTISEFTCDTCTEVEGCPVRFDPHSVGGKCAKERDAKRDAER